jgi:hypothetical protein
MRLVTDEALRCFGRLELLFTQHMHPAVPAERERDRERERKRERARVRASDSERGREGGRERERETGQRERGTRVTEAFSY